jgi:signal transduction histidine kinase
MDLTAEWLQSIEALQEVPLNQLQWLLDHCERLEINQDEYLFKSKDPIKGTYILIEGSFSIYIMQGAELREIARFGPKDIAGYLPFSRGKVLNSMAQALTKIKCLFLPREIADEMIRTQFDLTQALVHVMTTRVRNFTSQELQNEKMIALGKLSAGLTHELNNPAATIVRGSASLLKHLKFTPETFKQLMAIKVSSDTVGQLSEYLFEILNQKEKPHLTMLLRSSLEDDLLEWMNVRQIANAQEAAETFVDFGFNIDNLDTFQTLIPVESMSAVFNWVNNNLITEKMVMDIEEASRRIAHLVGAIKTFTHMDQGQGKQYADIHIGIRSTLTMLQYKIRKGNIVVDEDFDTTLPPVNALVGELNQVWTNLIDNALDAMETNGKGLLVIKTRLDKKCVAVTISDDGPGIPEEIMGSIFDPFFTTKEIDKGTGLGLDIVRRIVKQHNGSIQVISKPGRTEFILLFPINGN